MIVFASGGGGEVDKPIGSISEKRVDDTLNLNVRGTLFTVQKALPLPRDGGSIILNASNAHLKGFAGASVYAAAKAAVRSFARSWANGLKDRKIRVNSISPGTIGDTAAFAGISKELTDFYVSLVPLGSPKREGRAGECRAINFSRPPSRSHAVSRRARGAVIWFET